MEMIITDRFVVCTAYLCAAAGTLVTMGLSGRAVLIVAGMTLLFVSVMEGKDND